MPRPHMRKKYRKSQIDISTSGARNYCCSAAMGMVSAFTSEPSYSPQTSSIKGSYRSSDGRNMRGVGGMVQSKGVDPSWQGISSSSHPQLPSSQLTSLHQTSSPDLIPTKSQLKRPLSARHSPYSPSLLCYLSINACQAHGVCGRLCRASGRDE